MTWRDWLFGTKVRVLRLRSGDVVVLETDESLSPEHAAAVKQQWLERFPAVPVTVLTRGLHAAAVVRQGDAGMVPRPPSPSRPDPGVPDRRPMPWKGAT